MFSLQRVKEIINLRNLFSSFSFSSLHFEKTNRQTMAKTGDEANEGTKTNVLTRSKAFQKLMDATFKSMDEDGHGSITKDELYAGVLMIHLKVAKFAGSAACYVCFNISSSFAINLIPLILTTRFVSLLLSLSHHQGRLVMNCLQQQTRTTLERSIGENLLKLYRCVVPKL